MQVRLMLFDVL